MMLLLLCVFKGQYIIFIPVLASPKGYKPLQEIIKKILFTLNQFPALNALVSTSSLLIKTSKFFHLKTWLLLVKFNLVLSTHSISHLAYLVNAVIQSCLDWVGRLESRVDWYYAWRWNKIRHYCNETIFSLAWYISLNLSLTPLFCWVGQVRNMSLMRPQLSEHTTVAEVCAHEQW